MRAYKDLRPDELTGKDMSTVREADHAKIQRDKGHGELRDYSLNHTVEMRWDLNDEAKRDLIFELIIDGKTKVLLDWEQMQRLGRWV